MVHAIHNGDGRKRRRGEMPRGNAPLAMTLVAVFALSAPAIVTAQPYVVTHLAGSRGGHGSADGPADDARFKNPGDVAVGSSGALYVADTDNSTIRQIGPGGSVTTLAGLALVEGHADGSGSAARFYQPTGVTVDAAGVVYVADSIRHTIRRVTAAGVVTTIAGSPGAAGSADGVGSNARFNRPGSVAVDAAGTLYVADTLNHTIRKVTAAGVVTTLAGMAGVAGSVDGTGGAARFVQPLDVAVDAAGNVYVAAGHTIRKVTPAGVVTTLAGLAGAPGSTDGTGSAARFNDPVGVAVDASGTVHVADGGNHTIRRITASGVVTTVAGVAGMPGTADGTGSAARFSGLRGMAMDAAGFVYIADGGAHTIRRMTSDGTVTTVAGRAPEVGSDDGVGTTARFNLPDGVAVDGGGTVYVADSWNHAIRKVTAGGAVTTFAGVAGPHTWGSADGTGSDARFYQPSGVAVHPSGTVYVSDRGNNTIRAVTADGVVSTLAGVAGVVGSTDANGSSARFNVPEGVAVDASGAVYVADSHNHTIRKISPSGDVTTLAGLAGALGSADGAGAAARFYYPRDVAVDTNGMIYVADSNNHTIRRITPAGVVTTLAGFASHNGLADGAGITARFYNPTGVAVDGAGTVHVADSFNHILRRVTAAGVVTTPAGLARVTGSENGTGSAARFHNLRAVAVGTGGAVYVADLLNHAVRLALPSDADTDLDGLPDLWELQFGLDPASSLGADGGAGDPDGDGRTNLQEYQDGTHPRGFFTRYFAEGATSPFFDTTLALVNLSTTTAASVLLRFQRADGSAVPHHLSVGPRTRRAVDVKAVPDMATAEFSTVVESDEPIVADRTMTWDDAGYGSHAETSIASPATTWYLAEGATHSGFNLFYLLQNPNGVTANVEVTYLRPAPQAPLVRTYAVGPHARANIWVDLEPGLESTDVSAVFTSDVPIIVERAMYLDQPGRPFGAGHESAGIPAPATEWFLAEGATGSFFDLFVLIANPGDEDAAVTATFLRPVGPPVVKHYTVAAKSRFNVWVDLEDALLADTAVSTVVTSTNAVPIIVERAMWWPGPAWAGAHNSAGLTSTGRTWALAEGEVGGPRGLDTYILIANRGDDVLARVTLLYEDGTSESKDVVLPASSRTNVAVAAEFPNAMGRRFGAIVEALGASPEIAVERAMYGNASGIVWATGTNAVATKVQ